MVLFILIKFMNLWRWGFKIIKLFKNCLKNEQVFRLYCDKIILRNVQKKENFIFKLIEIK